MQRIGDGVGDRLVDGHDESLAETDAFFLGER
jgi:hypothetical protein